MLVSGCKVNFKVLHFSNSFVTHYDTTGLSKLNAIWPGCLVSDDLAAGVNAL